MMTDFLLYEWSSSSFEIITSKKHDLTPNTAVPCPSGGRSVRICEVCCRVMDSVLTCMPSVPPLTWLGAGESTVSSWKTGIEASSCLMGLNAIQQKIRSEAKQKKINTLHPMIKRYVIFNFSALFPYLLRAEMQRTQKYYLNKLTMKHFFCKLIENGERVIYMSSLKVIPLEFKRSSIKTFLKLHLVSI